MEKWTFSSPIRMLFNQMYKCVSLCKKGCYTVLYNACIHVLCTSYTRVIRMCITLRMDTLYTVVYNNYSIYNTVYNFCITNGVKHSVQHNYEFLISRSFPGLFYKYYDISKYISTWNNNKKKKTTENEFIRRR